MLSQPKYFQRRESNQELILNKKDHAENKGLLVSSNIIIQIMMNLYKAINISLY